MLTLLAVFTLGLLSGWLLDSPGDLSQKVRDQINSTPPPAEAVPSLTPIWAFFPFGVGRLAVYFALGAAAGFLGTLAFEQAVLNGKIRYLFVIIGVVLLALFFVLHLLVPSPEAALEKLGRSRLGRSSLQLLDRSPAPVRYLGLGMLDALFPNHITCALIVLAFTSWDSLRGTMLMLSFGFGTLPLMALKSLLPEFTAQVVKEASSGLVTVIVCLFAGVFFLRGAGYAFVNGQIVRDDLLHEGHEVSADDSIVRINVPFPKIELTDLEGKKHHLEEYRGKTVVLVTIGTHCPCVEAYRDRLNALAKRYEPVGVIFLGMNPNGNEPEAEIRDHQRKKPFVFPVTIDADQHISDVIKAKCMTETFLIDANGLLRYHGRIDDNIYYPQDVTDHTLENALNVVLGGKPQLLTSQVAMGCAIVRKKLPTIQMTR
ncbi:MAG: sulfite exporter TauE/SafE family protein [Acidobacteria bacterium]|nr:sulfite exporter TauE/SafE family protein [Acidobacteriota bacterium]